MSYIYKFHDSALWKLMSDEMYCFIINLHALWWGSDENKYAQPAQFLTEQLETVAFAQHNSAESKPARREHLPPLNSVVLTQEDMFSEQKAPLQFQN